MISTIPVQFSSIMFYYLCTANAAQTNIKAADLSGLEINLRMLWRDFQ